MSVYVLVSSTYYFISNFSPPPSLPWTHKSLQKIWPIYTETSEVESPGALLWRLWWYFLFFIWRFIFLQWRHFETRNTCGFLCYVNARDPHWKMRRQNMQCGTMQRGMTHAREIIKGSVLSHRGCSVNCQLVLPSFQWESSAFIMHCARVL